MKAGLWAWGPSSASPPNNIPLEGCIHRLRSLYTSIAVPKCQQDSIFNKLFKFVTFSLQIKRI